MSLIVQDSLGLGIKKIINKEKIYTDEENENFTRQLLTEEEKEEIKKGEILSIAQVREIIIENCNKDTYDKIEPDLLTIIDSRINYNIYVIEDNIYTYEELCMAYPFQEFNISTESIFVRQIIVYFERNNGNGDQIEVLNEGDPIVSTYDLIKISTNKMANSSEMNGVKKIIKSKIFIGGEKWKDFLQLRGFFRGIVQVSNLQIDNGQTPEFLKPFKMTISNHLSNTNGDANLDIAANSDISANLDIATNKKSINSQSINDQSINDQSINDQSINDQSINDQSINDQSINGQSINDRFLKLESNILFLKEQISTLEKKILILESNK